MASKRAKQQAEALSRKTARKERHRLATIELAAHRKAKAAQAEWDAFDAARKGKDNDLDSLVRAANELGIDL